MKTKTSPRKQAIMDMKKSSVNVNVLHQQKKILAISQLISTVDLSLLLNASI
jgi:hypothetical protein